MPLGTRPWGVGAIRLLLCSCSFCLWESFILEEQVIRSGSGTLYFGLHLAIVSVEILSWLCPWHGPWLGGPALHRGAGRGRREQDLALHLEYSR